MKVFWLLSGIPAALLFTTACGQSASQPLQPRAVLQRSNPAVRADSLFWSVFHSGRYQAIPSVRRALTAAFLQNPADHQTASHLGFLHAWALAERARLTSRAPEITDHATLARRYFERALQHGATADARIQGFRAVFHLTEGTITRDSAMVSEGMSMARSAIEAWPEFNWFTVGYVLSARSHTSPQFASALDMQWRTMDACSRVTVDRADPRPEVVFAARVGEVEPRRKRACWNSWIAPHNTEGFLLNMGDMLVKSGNWEVGRRVYRLAQALPSYQSWPYTQVLERRIQRAQANVAAFRSEGTLRQHGNEAIMLQSPFACSACHQAGW
jgi:hypothetical protein